MKRTIVKIKSKMATDEIWCDVNGCAFELMGAYCALTENLIQSFSKEGEYGIQALKILKKDAMEMFEEAGIKDSEDNGQNANNF